MEYSWLLTLLIEAKKWIDLVSQRGGEQKLQSESDYQDAVTALYTALNETQIYIASMQKKDAEHNEEIEANLSRLWTAAALKVRSYDIDLAERCVVKGEYWTDPGAWSDKDIKKARIKIAQVVESAHKLL
jgi:hypothetical protein